MTTLQDQLDWERDMIYRGVTRYRAQQAAAIEKGRESETSAGSRLLRSYVLQISDHIQLYLTGKLDHKRRNIYAKLMGTVNTDAIALFALRILIGVVFTATGPGAIRRRVSIQSSCHTLGGRIEDELRFSQFQSEHKEYYDAIIRNFEERRVTSYRYQHRALVFQSNEMGMIWKDWSMTDRVGVGALVISLLMEVCDLVEIETVVEPRGRCKKYIVPTKECILWVEKHDGFAELICPDRMPALIQPADWTGPFEGGFWSPRLRHMTPMVKRTGGAKGVRRGLLEEAVMPQVLTALNGLQATPWRLNGHVLEIMKEVFSKNLEIGMPRSEPYDIPTSPLSEDDKPGEWGDKDPKKIAFVEWKATARELHNMEAERVSKSRALIRTMRLASELENKEKFYYVYQCDFRGRIYCATTGLSPQGTDHSKALLTFARSEPLGERGLYWLKVHGANKFGYDKCGYDERVNWIDADHDTWMDVAANPLDRRAVWSSCDKPWQFLAWCFEYAAAMEFGKDFRSSLPVALDGSCNGLQHFSAMLRDEVGGRSVNLLASEQPEDIYQSVADVCTRKLRGLRSLNSEEHLGAANWLALFESLGLSGMPRKLSKTPVMTLPYGSTRQACTSSIFKWVTEYGERFFEKNTNFRHALYLCPILWESIGEVVIAARSAMTWVQKCSTVMSQEDRPLQYLSPLGFPVYQAAMAFDSKKIETQIGGRLQLRLALDTGKIDGRKQRQGSSPNLIHHVDATHLMMCVNAGLAEGIDCFAMIHDDFGCHANRVDTFQKIIRDTFVELHQAGDILSNFKKAHEERYDIDLPDLPATGLLDLSQVHVSKYFFG